MTEKKNFGLIALTRKEIMLKKKTTKNKKKIN